MRIFYFVLHFNVAQLSVAYRSKATSNSFSILRAVVKRFKNYKLFLVVQFILVNLYVYKMFLSLQHIFK